MHTPNSITCDDLVDDLDELKKDMGTFLLRFSDEDSIAYIGRLNQAEIAKKHKKQMVQTEKLNYN